MSLRAINVNPGIIKTAAAVALAAPLLAPLAARAQEPAAQPSHSQAASARTRPASAFDIWLVPRAPAALTPAHGKGVRPHAVVQPLKLPALSAFGWPKEVARDAKVKPSPHLMPGAHPVQGLGLFAIAQGHSADLTQPDRWADDSDVGSSETKVGLGWRKSNVSAMLGYMRPDFSRNPYAPDAMDHAQYVKPRSIVGLSFALRYQ